MFYVLSLIIETDHLVCHDVIGILIYLLVQCSYYKLNKFLLILSEVKAGSSICGFVGVTPFLNQTLKVICSVSREALSTRSEQQCR